VRLLPLDVVSVAPPADDRKGAGATAIKERCIRTSLCPSQSLCLYLCLPMSEQLFAITKRALGQINAVRCDWSRQLLEIEDSDSTLGQVSAELARHSA